MKTLGFLAATLLALPFCNLNTAKADSATWNLNPISSDWKTAANWMPPTVPNGPGDIATFDVSSVTDVSTREFVLVESIKFSSSASAFTISIGTGGNLSIIGSGIENNSGIMQNFEIGGHVGDASIQFSNSATAGTLTTFTVIGAGRIFAVVYFLQTSSAGNASFSNYAYGGEEFYDESSAGNGIFINNDHGGGIGFYDSSTADRATFTNNPAENGDGGGKVGFHNDSSAGESMITNNGSAANIAGYGSAVFEDSSSAENATIINNGSSVDRGTGGLTMFSSDAAAGNSTLIANGGTNGGGFVQFSDNSLGGTVRVQLFGNGTLDISDHNSPGVTIGSLEGDGLVFLGAQNLSIGSNALSTAFLGTIQDGGISGGTGGSLTKLGTGTLKLTGANSYTGGTFVEEGSLIVNNRTGSATGPGAVQLNAGTLGGRGTVAGPMTVGTGSGTGAFLAPSLGARKPAILTIQSALTFKADATYTYKLNTKRARADTTVANGVTIESGAQFSFKQLANKKLVAGTVFTAISNTSANSISGAFANLPDDSTFTVGRNIYQANYQGGDGNDLTLTVIL